MIPLLFMLLAIGGLAALYALVTHKALRGSASSPTPWPLPPDCFRFQAGFLLVSGVLVVFLIPWALTLPSLSHMRSSALHSLIGVLFFALILSFGAIQAGRKGAPSRKGTGQDRTDPSADPEHQEPR